MKVLVIFISMVVAIKGRYHDEVGIPLAAEIKAYEDQLFANPEMESRVVGSRIARDHTFPFMASLIIRVDGNSSACGSSLVSRTRLVTAGHCLQDARSIKVRLGSNYLFYGGIIQTTPVYKIHPNYEHIPHKFLLYDVGIIILLEKLLLSPVIQTISLPRTPADFEQVGESSFVAGWGFITDPKGNNTRPYDKYYGLSFIEPAIISEKHCLRVFNYPRLKGNVVCTSGDHHRGSCRGDSGGPLVVMREIPILVGINSFGATKCEAGWPSVFTKAEAVKDFILN